MSSRDCYAFFGRRLRIVFSWDDGLGALQRIEIDGRGRMSAVYYRTRTLPAKWTRPVEGTELAQVVELFREADFFTVGERPTPRCPQDRARRELALVIGGRNHRVCDGVPGPRPGTVLRPGRSLARIYRTLETMALGALRDLHRLAR
jgi:hypothetical protein